MFQCANLQPRTIMLISPPGNFKLSVIIERTVMCFLLTVSVSWLGVRGGVTLQPLGDVIVCPEAVTSVFMCNVTSQNLQWIIGPMGELSDETRIFRFDSEIGANVESSAPVPFTAILDHVTTTYRISTLTVQLDMATHAVVNVKCWDVIAQSKEEVSRIMPAGPPGVPADLEVIFQKSDGNDCTVVDLRWSPPGDTGGVTLDHYTLTLTSPPPPPFLPLTILTNDTTYTVTLPSNMTYNMTVTASNCAGTSLGRSELLNLSFSTGEVYCALPPGAITVGSHMDSTASAEEGTQIVLCPGGGLFDATCTTGGWVPSLPQPPYECNDSTTVATTDAQFVTTSEKSYTAATRNLPGGVQTTTLPDTDTVALGATIAGIACSIGAVFLLMIFITLLLVVIILHNKGASRKVTLDTSADSSGGAPVRVATAETDSREQSSPPLLEDMYSRLQTTYPKATHEKARNGYNIDEYCEVNLRPRNGLGGVQKSTQQQQQERQQHLQQQQQQLHQQQQQVLQQEKQQKQQQEKQQQQGAPPFYHMLESGTPLHNDTNPEVLLYAEVRTFDKPFITSKPDLLPKSQVIFNEVCDEGAVIPSKSNGSTINGSPQGSGGALLSHQALNHTDEDTPPPIPPQCFKMEQTYENTA